MSLGQRSFNSTFIFRTQTHTHIPDRLLYLDH